jgi:benzoate-CoA ligase family protein
MGWNADTARRTAATADSGGHVDGGVKRLSLRLHAMAAAVTFPERFNLADYYLFARLREGLGSKTALRFGSRAYSYDDVARRTRAFAAALEEADVRRGERVLIVLPDVPAFAWVFFGVLARGCVVAMGNPDSPLESLEYLVEYTRATAVVTVPRVCTALRERMRAGTIGREVRRVWCVNEVAALSGDEDPDGSCELADGMFQCLTGALDRIDPHRAPILTHRDEPAIWLFTSGSTGEPKANVHSHRDFAFNTEVYAKATVGYAPGDVTVSVPRLYFGYATGTNLMFPFAVGATVALFSERPTPESLARAIELYRPTVVTNVPTMLGKLLDHDQALHDAGGKGLDLSSVRFSLSAGEALPEPLLRRWLDRFGSDVYDGIGSAEMFHIYASNRPGDIKPGSLGKAVEGYELRILPEEADGPGAAPVAAGEIGVLWVKGDSVSHGYWLDRDKSWKVFHGHWCRTGDLFRIDEDGYLYFAGRADELLKVSGLWVAPVEVEECLMRHDAVLHAAVIGVMEDGLLKTKAFVQLRAGGQAGDELALELQEFVKARLAKHKYPRIVQFVDDLPKNDRGKVDRKLLREREKRT